MAVPSVSTHDTNYWSWDICMNERTVLTSCLQPKCHMTTHTCKRKMKKEEKRNNSFFFFKAAHYLTVSGCMAPSQNIMMRINSLGTTTFCWRPSQGSANAPPPKLFPFSPLFITDMGVCAVSSVDGELNSSCRISPIIRAAASSSVTPFTLLPSPLSLCALVKISTVSSSTSSPTSSSPCPLITSVLPCFLTPPSLPLLLPLPPHGTGYG